MLRLIVSQTAKRLAESIDSNSPTSCRKSDNKISIANCLPIKTGNQIKRCSGIYDTF